MKKNKNEIHKHRWHRVFKILPAFYQFDPSIRRFRSNLTNRERKNEKINVFTNISYIKRLSNGERTFRQKLRRKKTRMIQTDGLEPPINARSWERVIEKDREESQDWGEETNTEFDSSELEEISFKRIVAYSTMPYHMISFKITTRNMHVHKQHVKTSIHHKVKKLDYRGAWLSNRFSEANKQAKNLVQMTGFGTK